MPPALPEVLTIGARRGGGGGGEKKRWLYLSLPIFRRFAAAVLTAGAPSQDMRRFIFRAFLSDIMNEYFYNSINNDYLNQNILTYGMERANL